MSRLLAEISSAELAEWMAFEKEFGPLGGYRDDILAAQISRALYCLQASMAGKRPTGTLADHIMVWAPKNVQTPQDHLRMVKSLHAGMVRRHERRDKRQRGDGDVGS